MNIVEAISQDALASQGFEPLSPRFFQKENKKELKEKQKK